jgi:hypothetical protein
MSTSARTRVVSVVSTALAWAAVAGGIYLSWLLTLTLGWLAYRLSARWIALLAASIPL